MRINNNNVANLSPSQRSHGYSSKEAEKRASIALARAMWQGVERNAAFTAVLEADTGGHLKANPQILHQIWQSVAEQMTMAETREAGLVDE